MKNTNLPSEQPATDAETKAKRDAELAKARRRLTRDVERREKTPDQVAVCGINFYTLSPRERDRGCYWTHCHKCGKALRYFDSYAEAEAHNGECKRPE